MSNHGNSARAQDVNTRGEPTNSALAARNAPSTPASTPSPAAERALERERQARADTHRAEAARHDALAQHADARATALEAEARAAYIVRDEARAEADRARDARQREADRVRAAFDATTPKPAEKLDWNTPAHLAYLDAQGAAYNADPAWVAAMAAQEAADERYRAANDHWNALVDQVKTLRAAEATARFHADRHTALAARATDPTAYSYAHLGPESKAYTYIRNATEPSKVTMWLKYQFPHLHIALAGAPLDAVRAVAEELVHFAHEHPYAMNDLNHIGYLNDPAALPMVEAHALLGDRSLTSEGKELSRLGGQALRAVITSKRELEVHGIILTNSALDSTHPDWRDSWDKATATNWQSFAPEAYAHGVHPAAYVLRHELGHIAHYTLLNRAYGVSNNARGTTSDTTTPIATPESRAAARTVNYLQDLHERTDPLAISQYANSDEPNSNSEHVAEAFAAARYGTPASMTDPFTRAVAQMAEAYA